MMCSGWCTEYDSMLGRRYMHNKDCKKKPAMEEGHQ